MSYQFVLILIGILGVIVSVLGIIVIGFIIYYYLKAKGERENLLSKVPENLHQQLEKMVGPEINKTIFEASQKIQKATDEILESYKKQMVEAPQELKDKIYKFSDACSQAQDMILKESKVKADEIGNTLAKEINLVYQSVEKTINQNIIQAEKSIDDHRRERIKEIDKKIYQMIGEVAKKTLGETIDLSTHEKLVMESLEKAKKEKIF